jgi:hypothetical protein
VYRIFGRIAAATIAAAMMVFGANGASAQDSLQGLAVGFHSGTTGVGLDATLGLNKYVAVRGSLDGLIINHDATWGNIPYKGKWKGVTGGVFADIHPLNNSLMLTAGAYEGSRSATIVSTPTGPVTIKKFTFTPAQMGSLQGGASMQHLQPFVGAGFNNTFRTKSRWSINAVVGAAYGGSPKVTLTSVGGQFSTMPMVQQWVTDQQTIITNAVHNYKFYPVATMGVSYRF